MFYVLLIIRIFDFNVVTLECLYCEGKSVTFILVLLIVGEEVPICQ